MVLLLLIFIKSKSGFLNSQCLPSHRRHHTSVVRCICLTGCTCCVPKWGCTVRHLVLYTSTNWILKWNDEYGQRMVLTPAKCRKNFAVVCNSSVTLTSHFGRWTCGSIILWKNIYCGLQKESEMVKSVCGDTTTPMNVGCTQCAQPVGPLLCPLTSSGGDGKLGWSWTTAKHGAAYKWCIFVHFLACGKLFI